MTKKIFQTSRKVHPVHVPIRLSRASCSPAGIHVEIMEIIHSCGDRVLFALTFSGLNLQSTNSTTVFICIYTIIFKIPQDMLGFGRGMLNY